MSQIVLVRLDKPQWSYGSALAQTRHCRLDPSSTQHAASVDEQGILHYFHFDAASKASTELLSFQLQLCSPEPDAAPEPIQQPWSFEFVPGLPGEIMLVQANSCRILYASLPRQGTNLSDVFLFGSHSARVTCITTNGNIALSGCSEGSLRLWRMADGQLADAAVSERAGTAVTAVECLGPLMVSRSPGPRVPDGGGVLPGLNVGAPWRGLGGARQEDAAAAPPAALLAAAGPAGQLQLYQASLPGPHSWHTLHSSSPGSLAGPITAVAFSPAGDTLAVAGPAVQLLGTDATAVAAAGGQPGAVSLYSISSSSSSSSRGLQLWQQWCVRSLPLGLAVLPSSGVQLLTGRQLGATQVLHILITPELGSSVVLTASQPLEDPTAQQQQHRGISPPEPEAAGAAAAAESASWFRKPSTLPTLRSWMDRAAVLSAGTAAEGPTALDLEALAEEMQQQATQQQQQRAAGSAPAEAGLAASSAQQQQQQQQQADEVLEARHPGLPGEDAAAEEFEEDAAAAAAAADEDELPLMNSSRLLERKLQEAQQPPQVCVDPTAPAAMRLAVQLAELDLPLEQQQYIDLQDLQDIPTPTHARKLVPKQLDARWVASRSLKPQLDTLFNPQEWQPGSVAPQVLLLPSWPTPQQVVQQLLWPGMQQDAA
ncbi:hypothetical protein OEZ86_008998 [Tetradesmus obliquus]|nr:hypothetical protein OEZ86_008998 [Tetradesmus obliquus]